MLDDHAVALVPLARALKAAGAALEEATALARGLALRALAEGWPESETAQVLGVDRMTIRQWAGE